MKPVENGIRTRQMGAVDAQEVLRWNVPCSQNTKKAKWPESKQAEAGNRDGKDHGTGSQKTLHMLLLSP